MRGGITCILFLFFALPLQDDRPVVLTEDDNSVVPEDATSVVLSSWPVAAIFSGSAARNNWNGFCTTLQRTVSSCRGLCVCCFVCSMPRATTPGGARAGCQRNSYRFDLLNPRWWTRRKRAETSS